MCLFTQHIKPRVADKDIVCYKLVRHNLQHPQNAAPCAEFKSEIWDFVYELGKTYTEESFQEDLRRINYVNNGFHTFNTLKDLDRMRNTYPVYFTDAKPGYEFVIVKCVIPAGALYWTGADSETEGIRERCSNQIRIETWRRIGETEWRDVVNPEENPKD